MAKKRKGGAFETVAAGNGLEELRLGANGLRVLLLPDPSVPVVAACVVYHVGSRNEAVGHTGATHLLEHLLFKGSRKFNPAEGRPIARTLERVGANFNATTWFDRTNYYETLPAQHLELALEIEADRMRHALLRAEDLASEMTVVRNEFERGENDPFDVLLKQSFAVAFREHPYHHPTIGWRDDIENASIERLRHFYDTFYHPDNASLILVGAFERNEALDLVVRHYGVLPPAPTPIPKQLTREPAQEGELRFVVRRSAEVGWVVVSWRTPAAAHPDTHALAVLSDALAGGVTSRLHQRLVESGRCLNVQSIGWQLRDPGLFQVFSVLNQDTTHQQVEETIREELAAVARDGFAEEELERARVQVEAQVAFHRDSPGQVAAALTEAVSAADWRFYLDYLDRIRAVSLDDVRRVAATYFHDDAISVGYFVPRGNGRRGGGAAAATAAGARTLRPAPCGLRAAVAPQVHAAALPGGARLFLVPRHHNPTVHLHGSLLAGHALEPVAGWTAASALPELLERGTERHDRMAMARTLEDRGIDLDVSGESFNPLEVFCSGRCLSRHTELMLELLVDMLRRPTLPEEELEKVRILRLGELAQAQEDTFLRAYDGLSRLIYPTGHPHCRRTFADRKAGLEALDRAALVAAHARLYGPASLVLAMVGDFDPAAVTAHLGALLAGWNGGVATAPAVPRLAPADGGAGECREAMPDKPNLDVVLGHAGGLRRRDADFLAAVLGNSVLGHSTLSSRLGQRLRDREGLTYGVISRFFGASLVDGPWAVTFSVSPDNLDRAIASVRDEVERLLAEGPSEAEMDDERAAMAGSYRVALANPSGVARELARLARHALPPSEIDALPEAVLATPTAAVREALRRHVDPSRLAVAVAGELAPTKE
jgi:zinc protease